MQVCRSRTMKVTPYIKIIVTAKVTPMSQTILYKVSLTITIERI